jgi:hypothetical protein
MKVGEHVRAATEMRLQPHRALAREFVSVSLVT